MKSIMGVELENKKRKSKRKNKHTEYSWIAVGRTTGGSIRSIMIRYLLCPCTMLDKVILISLTGMIIITKIIQTDTIIILSTTTFSTSSATTIHVGDDDEYDFWFLSVIIVALERRKMFCHSIIQEGKRQSLFTFSLSLSFFVTFN